MKLTAKRASCFLLGALFAAAGVNHFANPGLYKKIMPPAIPAPEAMVYISGVAEIAGGLGLMVSRTRRPAGQGLCVLLLAVFPANLYMAFGGVKFGGFVDTPAYTAIRLPLQFVLMGWVYWASGSEVAAPEEVSRDK